MFSIFASNFKFLRVLPLSELLSALGSKSRGPWFKIILLPVAVYLFVYLSISVCLSPVSLSIIPVARLYQHGVTGRNMELLN